MLWSDAAAALEPPRPRPPRTDKTSDLDIFQVERLWIDEAGQRFIYGHHFLRPRDTFHEVRLVRNSVHL